MIKLDRPALDYMVQMAADAGFALVSISTEETDGACPIVSIKFRQKANLGLPQAGVEPSIFAGVTEKQAKAIADEGKAKMMGTRIGVETLDEGTEA